MKDGIYRVTLTIDGQPVVAEAHVRNGVLQGLGELSGLLGVISPAGTLSSASSLPAPDAGIRQDLSWTRRDLPARTDGPLAVDANALAGPLHRVHEEAQAIRRDAVPMSPATDAAPAADRASDDRGAYFCEWPDAGRRSQTRLHS